MMASRHLSLRLEADTFDRLESESRRVGRTRSEIAKTLLEEGLRMEAFPGVVFRSGPAGRRAGLAGGPDVWEVARVFRETESRGEEAVKDVAQLTELVPSQVRVALGYYAAFRAEIDAWMDRVDDEAAQAETAWRREQALLRQ